MHNTIKILAVISSFLYVFCTDNLMAQQNTTISEDGKFYGRLDGGVIVANDTIYSISGSLTNLSVTATGTVSGEIKSKTGYAIGGALGYRLNDNFAVEAQISHLQFELDSASVDVAGTLTSGGSNLAVNVNTDIDLEGDVSTLTGMFNLFDRLPLANKLTPYVGAGLGFVNWEINLDSISQGGTTLTVNGQEDDTDLAANLIVGLEYPVTDQIWLGGRYTYIWTDTGTDISEDVTANIFQASAKFRF